jgi:hypothetical protein
MFSEFDEEKEAIRFLLRSLFSSWQDKVDGRIRWQRLHELTKPREEGMPPEHQMGMF